MAHLRWGNSRYLVSRSGVVSASVGRSKSCQYSLYFWSYGRGNYGLGYYCSRSGMKRYSYSGSQQDYVDDLQMGV